MHIFPRSYGKTYELILIVSGYLHSLFYITISFYVWFYKEKIGFLFVILRRVCKVNYLTCSQKDFPHTTRGFKLEYMKISKAYER
ncbi:MAG: hypothetical protein CR967_05535 [Proteobacteria bacterium]|nr:MAG: hypothetical protein CR967_05535 [Pseudomonadota bacterium]